MFGRRKKNVVELPSDINDTEVEAILDDIIKDDYAADLTPLIKFVTGTPIELAHDREYTKENEPAFYCSYGTTTFMTLVFADRAVTVETYYSTLGRKPNYRDNSTIRVYRKEFSPQLDLFNEVAAFPLIGSIAGADVSPDHFNELFSFMSAAIKAARLERKKESINNVLRIFE